MALWQLDAQYALPSALRGQPYYWTNVYYWLQDDPLVPDASIVSRLSSITRQSIPTYAVLVRLRAVAPSGALYFVGPANVTGSAPFGGVPGPLANVVRVDLYSVAGVFVGYKRLRGAWPLDLYRGGDWSDDLVGYYQNTWAPVLLAAPMCNWRGVSIARVAVRPALHGWQIRHGSKRASRPVFT